MKKEAERSRYDFQLVFAHLQPSIIHTYYTEAVPVSTFCTIMLGESACGPLANLDDWAIAVDESFPSVEEPSMPEVDEWKVVVVAAAAVVLATVLFATVVIVAVAAPASTASIPVAASAAAAVAVAPAAFTSIGTIITFNYSNCYFLFVQDESNTMKVLHLSDFHIDLTYTQGALVDCQVFNESIILLKKNCPELRDYFLKPFMRKICPRTSPCAAPTRLAWPVRASRAPPTGESTCATCQSGRPGTCSSTSGNSTT